VELGSGQSFMIGGLLRNNNQNTADKAPFLGDLPIIGALFRSKGFRRNETELVIVVTPYLVKPVNDSQIALPTDGYHMPNDAASVLLDQRHDGRDGEQRPMPRAATPQTVAPGIGDGGTAALPAPAPTTPTQQPVRTAQQAQPPKKASPAPGFSF
jgi:pilus assembly protein CpaC